MGVPRHPLVKHLLLRVFLKSCYLVPHFKFTMTSIAGDWEMVTDKCPVPVKVTLAGLPGMWLMAAMIPKGNMIQCMLRKEGDRFHLEKLKMGRPCSSRWMNRPVSAWPRPGSEWK